MQYVLFVVLFILFFNAGVFSEASAAVKLGDRGEEVREVQTCLIAQELLSGEADGVCGEATVAAIKEFQSAVGLPVDGICGEAPFRLLHAAAYGEIDITNFMVESASAEPAPTETHEQNENYAEVGDVIKQGMQGPGVANLQNKLIELGFLATSADGICGAATVTALKNFQSSVGMPADGVCGIMTYAALEDYQYSGGNVESNDSYDNADEDLPLFQRSMTVEATAYSAYENNSSRTASGTYVRRGVIAVDPRIIPLGTRVYIPGYGVAIAEDTGGSIIGNRIDIAFDSYGEAMSFGRQVIEIYILDD